MGANQSTADVQAEVDQVEQGLTPNGQAPNGNATRLYRFVFTGTDGVWETASSNARPRFYDANEDTSTSSRSKKSYHLEVEAGDIDAHVDQEMNYVMDVKQRRVTFHAGGAIWALKFASDEAARAFAEELNDAAFYNQYGVDCDDDGRAKVMEDYSGVLFSKDPQRAFEPMDVDDGDVDTRAAEAATPDRLREFKTKETEGDEDMIMGIVMGAGDSNFLMRGRTFDVLRNTEGGGVTDAGISFKLTPPPSAGGRGAGAGVSGPGFTPSKVMLSHGERRMNLLTPDNKSALYHADIEVGKIVSTFSFQKDSVEIPITEIANDYKAAQLEEHNTFLGLDSNRLCKWDLRDRRGVVQTSETGVAGYAGGKDYARGTNFTCMATSGDGYVAVGAKDGKIRLYSSKTLTQAKTSIPGLGAPITAIDVTYDGKWVLATTDHYLMVVKTTYTTDKGEQASGFTTRMGGRGAVPRLLRLKPEDQARTHGARLTKGRFTWITESGQSERWVVAHCGKSSVIWNFTKVRCAGTESLGYGGLPTSMDYTMTASKEEEVVDAAFVHQKYMRDADQSALIMATQHKLFNLQ